MTLFPSASPSDFAGLASVIKLLKTDRTRLPFVVEFCGLPKAGKTTILHRTRSLLEELGLSPILVPEAATNTISTALRGDLFIFNVLCTLENISQVIEQCHRRTDVDVVLLDRGVTDGLVWLEFLRQIGLLPPEFYSTIEQFVRLPPWFDRTHLLVCLDSNWESYHARYNIDSIVPAEPKINHDRFKILRKCYSDVIKPANASRFPAVLTRDCSLNCLPGEASTKKNRIVQENICQASQLCIDVANAVLDGIVASNKELIAVLTTDTVRDFVDHDMTSEDMSNFIQYAFGRKNSDGIRTRGAGGSPIMPVQFLPRDAVERDLQYLQIVASAFIRRRDELLVLRRSNKEERAQLRGRLTIIVGGHVDATDLQMRFGGNNEVENCLLRELKEELTHLDMPDIKPSFAFRLGDSEMGRRHLGLIYQVSTLSSHIDVVDLPGAGNYETSPEFWSIAQLRSRSTEFDEWSRHIIDRLR